MSIKRAAGSSQVIIRQHGICGLVDREVFRGDFSSLKAMCPAIVEKLSDSPLMLSLSRDTVERTRHCTRVVSKYTISLDIITLTEVPFDA